MMAPLSRIINNSFWMIPSRFVVQGLAVIFTMLLARRLDVAEFGGYAFIAAILFAANALTTFGTDMLLIREIAGKDDLSGLPAALTIQSVLSLVFIALVWSLGAWMPNQSDETITALKVYSLALVPLAFFTIFTTALRGKQLMNLYALLNIVVSLLQLGAVLMLRDNDLIFLFSFLLLVQFLAALVAGLLCFFTIPHFWRSWSLSSSQPFPLLKAAAPLALLTLLTMLYQRLSVTMLSLMTGPADTGIFFAAARIVEASKMAHIAIFAVLYPMMANGMSLQAQRSHLKFLVTGAIFISLLLFAFAAPLVRLLYGKEFISSSNIVQILSWILIPFTVNTYLTLSLLASKKEHLVGWALTASLLGMLILNLWWIPSRGVAAAAWTSLIAECLQVVILLVSVPSHVLIKGASHEFPHIS